MAKFLIEKGGEVHTKTSIGYTPLHSACFRGHLEMAKFLIEKGGEVNTKKSDGDTPLHDACYKGHLEIVKLLIQKGAEVNAKGSDDEKTPLHYACMQNHSKATKFLIENGADVDAKANDGLTPLLWACENRDLEAAKLLLATVVLREGIVEINHANEDKDEGHAVLQEREQLDKDINEEEEQGQIISLMAGEDLGYEGEEVVDPVNSSVESQEHHLFAVIQHEKAISKEAAKKARQAAKRLAALELADTEKLGW